MFEEAKDRDAAEREFLALLNEAIKSQMVSKTEAKSERDIFIRQFIRVYNDIKANLTQTYKENNNGVFDPSRNPDRWFDEVLGWIRGASEHIMYHPGQKRDPKELAEELGTCIGMFLAAVEYGVAMPWAFTQITAGYEGHYRFYREVYDFTEKIARALKQLNKHVKHKFIRNRLIKIGKIHKDQLRDGQKKLLAQIAACFV